MFKAVKNFLLSFKRAAGFIAPLLVLTFIFSLAYPSFAVVTPCKGVSVTNATGTFIYSPDQTTGACKIKAYRNSDGALIDTEAGLGGLIPFGMVASRDGKKLYVALQATGVSSYVRVFDINADGTLTTFASPNYIYTSIAGDKYKQIAIDPSGKYLYVAESNVGKVTILDISGVNATKPVYAGQISDANLNGKSVFGLAMHPTGTRLYVGIKSDPGYIYVYNTTNKTAPVYMATISSTAGGDLPYPSFIDIDTSGTKFFVRIYEDHSPYRDILAFNASDNSYITYIRKTAPLGDHMPYYGGDPHWDIDMSNVYEGMTISPNGWFLFFSHFHGLSGDGDTTYRIKLYGTALSSVETGVVVDASPLLWEQWGGLQSSDNLVTDTKQDIWLDYSNGGRAIASTNGMNGLRTIDATDIPTAPKIIYPTPEVVSINVSYISWEPSIDLDPGLPLTYEVQSVPTSEVANANAWINEGYTSGETFLQFQKATPEAWYYFRVRAYDGRFAGGWSYVGPVHIKYLPPPTWESHYLVASHEAVITWPAVLDATSYILGYKLMGAPNWTTVEVSPPWYTSPATNPNPNYRLNTGITELSSYEVRIKSKNITFESVWSDQIYVKDHFYSLERPWIDFYKPASTEVYLTWGPEVNTAETKVPLADHFELQYRINGNITWENATPTWEVLTNASIEDTSITKLNILFNNDDGVAGLTPHSTYEVRIRTNDNTSGWQWSDWSDGKIFHTLRSPWWVDYSDLTTREVRLYWDNTAVSSEGAVSYEVSYGISPDATGGPGSPISPIIVSATNEVNLSSLIQYTYYYAKVRAIYPANEKSDWSPIINFFTMGRPDWVSHYAVTSHEATITWDPCADATNYIIGYKTTAEVNWTTFEVSAIPTSYNISLLQQLTSYEVKVRAKNGTFESTWAPVDRFFTLERPWADFYKPSSTEVHITWGPEVSTRELPVPLSSYYEMEYRENTGEGFGIWIDSGQTLDNTSYYDSPGKLNILFNKAGAGLTPNATYEARIRTVGSGTNWRWSDWSNPITFRALRSPWWVEIRGMDQLAGTAEAFWDDFPRTKEAAASYTVSYGTSSDATGTIITPVVGTNESILSSLTEYTTYYVKVRANYAAGQSDWSPIKQFYFMQRPEWISHYMVASHEATVNWPQCASASTYIIGYKTTADATWTTKEVSAASTNNRLTLLSQLSSYEVKVKSKNSTGESDWSSTDNFYTLERPWIDFYKPGTTEVNVTWGPEVNTLEVIVPLSNRYDMEYRFDSGSGFGLWTSYEGLNNSTREDTGNLNLNFLFKSLSSNSTYEVRIRTVDNTGGVSDWSSDAAGQPKSFHTFRAPWWVDYDGLTTSEVRLFWDNVPVTTFGATSYIVSYGTSTEATGGPGAPVSPITVSGTNEQKITGLTSYTTYYAKARAVYAGGILSDWSPIKSFYTMDRPDWVAHYMIASHEATINWDACSSATSYVIGYKITTDATFTTLEVPAVSTNYKLTGLTQLSSYEVKVRAKNASAIGAWSPEDVLFTLEKPWIDYYNPGTREVYLVWGPEVSTLEIPIPLSNTYDLQYRTYSTVSGYSGWASAGETLNNVSHDDGTNSKLNILFDLGGVGLTQDTTYEVRIRTAAVGSGWHWSDWGYLVNSTSGLVSGEHPGPTPPGPTPPIVTLRSPWWVDYDGLTTSEVRLFWDNTPVATFGATSYQVSYGTSLDATGGIANPVSPITVATNEQKITGLTPYTTYYAKVRAIYPTGTSNWSPIKSFYTMDRPDWVAHYMVASHEATVNWDACAAATSYIIGYKITTDATFTTLEVPAVSTNYKLTGLTQLSSYEVKVRAKNASAIGAWSPEDVLFTLEKPWIDYYNPGTREVYLVWGPEVSTTEIPVPLSNIYDLEYRTYSTVSGYSGWASAGETLNNVSHDDGTNSKLNILFDLGGVGLTQDTTYEARIRTASSNTGWHWSDWGYLVNSTSGLVSGEHPGPTPPGPTPPIVTLRSPWWVDCDGITTSEVRLFWDTTPVATFGATSYIVSYGTSTDATGGIGSPVSPMTVATNEQKITGLIGYTTYYAKVKAVYPSGMQSNWSPIKSFFTMGRPAWIAHYLVSSHEATVNWAAYPSATSYVIGYKITTDATWTTTEVPAVPTNYKLTGLTQLSSYEVKVMAKTAGTASDWSLSNYFFTLERPWIDYYNPGTREVYLVWGPEVSTLEIPVPLSNTYDLQYRTYSTVSGYSGWASAGEILNNVSHDDPTNSKLNILFDLGGVGLTQDTTYEVRIRTASSGSGWHWSDWGYLVSSTSTLDVGQHPGPTPPGPTPPIVTLRSPWWVDYDGLTTSEVRLFWDNTPVATFGATSYQVSYGTSLDATGGIANPVSPITVSGTNEQKITGLTAYTIYYAKVRAIYPTGTSNWSTIKSFYTMDRPDWVSHYLVTSHEATVNWDACAAATSYIIGYKITTDATFTTLEVPAVPTNYKLTGLTQLSSYEVKVRAKNASAIGDWSPSDHLYTLEKPWVDFYKPGTNEVNVTWGPEINSSEVIVPLSNRYDMQYRFDSGAGFGLWTNYNGLNNSTREDTANTNLNFLFKNLITNSTYEVRIRTVDNTGGVSEWSSDASGLPKSFHTYRAPWWVDYDGLTTSEVRLFWDNTPVATFGATSYQVSYGTSLDATGGIANPVSPITVGVNEQKITGLTSYTTYYAKARAVYAGGILSDWSPIKSFYTMDRPNWVAHYMIASHEATLNWASCTAATSYIIGYKITTDATFTTLEVPAVPTNYKLTGLTQLSSYEVKIRAKNASAIGDWSTSDYFFTLEKPWVDYYNPGTREVYLVWGPEVSTAEIPVPLSISYDLQYRTYSPAAGFSAWANAGETLNNTSHDDGTNSKLNILFDLGGIGLIQDTTYEVRIRTAAVGSGWHWSDWGYLVSSTSTLDGFQDPGTNPGPTPPIVTLRSPWWVDYDGLTTTEVRLFWDNTPVATFGATSYQVSYGTSTDATGTLIPSVVGTNEQKITGLAASTTYYAKVRAIYPTGTSNWSPIKSFFTMDKPDWVAHYSITSHEATVNWDVCPSATSYIIGYKITTDATWATLEVPAVSTIYRLTGLTQLSSYEVKVRAKNVTTISEWSPEDMFYTLEKPWVDFYKPGTNEVYVTWGPEVNSSEVIVPLSNRYNMEYRVDSGAGFGVWTNYNGLNNSTREDTANTNLNFLFKNLITNSTYEVRIRTVDNTGGVSEWSLTMFGTFPIFHTLRSPWWIDYDGLTTSEVRLFWDNAPVASFGATSYTVSYGTSIDAAGGIANPVSPITVSGTDEQKLTGLTPFTTYYAKVLAVYPSGSSDWSPTISFFAMQRPGWISAYNVATNEAYLTWEAVNAASPTYEVSYGTDEAATNKGSIFNISNNYYGPLTPLITLTDYYVKVRAYYNGHVSDWSPIKSFLTSPGPKWIDAYNPWDTGVFVTWESTGASTYEFSYSQNIDAEGPGAVVFTKGPGTGTISIEGLPTAVTYYIKVRSISGTNESDWSPIDSFFTKRGPWWVDTRGANLAMATTEAFWDNTPTMLGATSYIVSYGTDINATNLGQKVGVTTNEVTLTGLTPYIYHYVKVRASYGGVLTDWCSIKQFFFMDKPEWISHYNVNFTQASLTWDSVTVPSLSYEVSYGTSPDATGIMWSPTPQTLNYGTVLSLSQKTWYYTKVRSHSGANVSDWSSIDTFYTLPRPMNLDHNNVSDESATISWEAVTGVATYEISFGTSTDATGTTITTTDIWSILTGLATGDTYYVKVRALDPNGYSDWSDIDIFVASTEAAITMLSPTIGYRGTTVKIGGSNFGTVMGTVEFNGVVAAPAYWKDSEIAVCVPAGAATGFNIITVQKPGKPPVSSNPLTFTVNAGRYVFDDFEGGMYHYNYGSGATFETEYGVFNIHEGVSSIKVNYSYPGSGWGAGVGGAMPTCEAIKYPSVDISSYEAITFWIKGDGSTNVATFELVEAFNVNGNATTSSEVWAYKIPIPLNDTGWHQVVIDLAPANFTREAFWWDGNYAFDKSTISGYHLSYRTNGVTAAYQYVDYVEAGPKTAMANLMFTLYRNSRGDQNWISTPFSGAGLDTTVDLAASIAAAWASGPGVIDGDIIQVSVFDNNNKSPQITTYYYDGFSSIWGEDFSYTAEVGAKYIVYIQPGDGRNVTFNWTTSGTIPTVGTPTTNLYRNSKGDVNWVTIPWMHNLLTTIDLSASIAAAWASGPGVIDGDIIQVSVFDNNNKSPQITTYYYDGGSSTWGEDYFYSTGAGLPYSVYIQPGDGRNVSILNWY